MKPICVGCKCFYRVKKTGKFFVEGMPIAPMAKKGRAEPENWKPYKIWAGDLWECPECGHETIAGVGWNPVSEHYLPDFPSLLEKLGPDPITINDC